VLTEKVRILPLLLNVDNKIVFIDGDTDIKCGYLKDTWLGRKIKLDSNCRIFDYEEIIEEDDGVEFRKIKYAITKFSVSEQF
jgi:hypothetical protein